MRVFTGPLLLFYISSFWSKLQCQCQEFTSLPRIPPATLVVLDMVDQWQWLSCSLISCRWQFLVCSIPRLTRKRMLVGLQGGHLHQDLLVNGSKWILYIRCFEDCISQDPPTTFLSYIDSAISYSQVGHPVYWARPKLKHEGIFAERDGNSCPKWSKSFKCIALLQTRRIDCWNLWTRGTESKIEVFFATFQKHMLSIFHILDLYPRY